MDRVLAVLRPAPTRQCPHRRRMPRRRMLTTRCAAAAAAAASNAMMPIRRVGHFLCAIGPASVRLLAANPAQALVAELRATFKTGRTKGVAWRRTQLRQLQLMLEENHEQFTVRP